MRILQNYGAYAVIRFLLSPLTANTPTLLLWLGEKKFDRVIAEHAENSKSPKQREPQDD